MGIYYAENLHYYTRDCCLYNIHGSLSNEAHAAIKGGQEASPEAPLH